MSFYSLIFQINSWADAASAQLFYFQIYRQDTKIHYKNVFIFLSALQFSASASIRA
jgi:hypothetical protein